MSRLRMLASVGYALTLAACASFSDVPPAPSDSPLHGAAPPEVRVTTNGKYFVRMGSAWEDFDWLSGIASAEQAIAESGWVTVVTAQTPAPTLVLELTEHQGEGPAGLTFLTGFVIPSSLDRNIALKLEWLADGAPPATCARSADVRTWYQTLLIVAYPFRAPGYRRMKTTQALALQCLAELLERRPGVTP